MESYKTSKAQIGDVITSQDFTYCICELDIEWDDQKERKIANLNKDLLTIDGYKSESHPVGFISHYDRKGRSIEDEIETAYVDETRGLAKFVVEKTAMDGGGTGHGPGDVYPDGWHIYARRLNEDGTYNLKGEVIEFYQRGCFNCMVKEVKVVGKMKINFTLDEKLNEN